MGWIIFWRLVPGRRGITGQVTSPLWSTSCGQPEAARWQTRKTLLDPSYTTSIWGEPCKQKFAHRLCSIVRMLNPVFLLSYPAFFYLFMTVLKQSVGLHVRRPQWHQHEQPRGAGQHLQQLFLRWAFTTSEQLMFAWKLSNTSTFIIYCRIPAWCP